MLDREAHFDWVRSARGLYAIIDPAHGGGRDTIAFAEAILSGGCAVMQLRAKAMLDGDLLALARQIATRAAARGVPFVMNDRPDLALLSGADGLHLGQGDLPIAEARRIVGAMPIGYSTHDAEQARSAIAEGADLIGLGPIFETRSKERPDPLVGLERLEQIARSASVPLVAIGGIDFDRIDRVAQTGVPLAAVIGALAHASDPRAAAEVLHRRWHEGVQR